MRQEAVSMHAPGGVCSPAGGWGWGRGQQDRFKSVHVCVYTGVRHVSTRRYGADGATEGVPGRGHTAETRTRQGLNMLRGRHTIPT